MSTPSHRTSKPSAKKPTLKREAKPAKPTQPKAKASNSTAAALRTAVGASLLAAVKEAPDVEGIAAVSAIAEALAKGASVGHGQLKELKASVNALARALRTTKKSALARQFSQANRGVRRLERAARSAS
jgi:hypothetical protein